MWQPRLFPANCVPQQAVVRRDGDLLRIPEAIDTVPFTHGLHRFAGKFIPQVVRYLMHTYLPAAPERRICDPFCGCGTTLVEAALAGRPFVGMDLDPLAVLIATAKTVPLTREEMKELASFWREHDYSRVQPEVIPRVPRLHHWFTQEAVDQLSSIKYACNSLSPRTKLFSLVVLSSIIRRVSNADDQSHKTYVSHTLPKSPPLPSDMFPQYLSRAIDGMRDYARALREAPRGWVWRGDARLEMESMEFDDVITSPPYLASIDYVYNTMLEYFWLLEELDIGSYEGYRRFRKQPMGFQVADQNTPSAELRRALGDQTGVLEATIDEIARARPQEAGAVVAFFLDFYNHILTTRARQRSGGMYLCVVGDSLVRGTRVPTTDLCEALFRGGGYELVDRCHYEIKRHYMKFPRKSNSGKIKIDNILVMRAR